MEAHGSPSKLVFFPSLPHVITTNPEKSFVAMTSTNLLPLSPLPQTSSSLPLLSPSPCITSRHGAVVASLNIPDITFLPSFTRLSNCLLNFIFRPTIFVLWWEILSHSSSSSISLLFFKTSRRWICGSAEPFFFYCPRQYIYIGV